MAFSTDDDEAAAEFADRIDDVRRLQVAGLADVDMEDLLHVLDDAYKVSRKVSGDGGIDAGEDPLSEELPICFELLELFVKLDLRLEYDRAVVETGL